MKTSNELNIIYTVDDAFIKLAAVSIESFVENNPNKHFNFFICTEKDDSTDNYHKLIDFYKDNERISFKFLDCKMYDNIFEKHNLDKWGSPSYFTYWRLIAFDLIDVEYASFIDADTLCLTDFCFPELNGKPIGCVIDSVHPHCNDVIGISRDTKIYNSGAIYVNVASWKEKRFTQRIIDYIENVNDKYFMADQELLSLALQEDIEPIDPQYNFFSGYDYYGVKNSFKINSLAKKSFYKISEVEKAQRNPIIYHCLDGVFKRPWIEDSIHPIKDKYIKYMTNSAFNNIVQKKELSGVFVIEKKLEILPMPIYVVVHNIALWMSFELQKRRILDDK